MDDVHKISRLLHNWGDGDKEALDELFKLVYGELSRRACIHLAVSGPATRFRPQPVVHEAYMPKYALAKQTDKRGGGALKLGLSDVDVETPSLDLDLIALDEALDRISKISKGERPSWSVAISLAFHWKKPSRR